MKSLTTITGNLDDMDQTVLSVEELAYLVNDLAALRLENKRLQEHLEAIGAGGVEPLRKRQDHVEDDLNMVAADAARYRWLRDPNRPDDSDEEGNFIPGVISGLFICVDESLSEGISGDELDAAIDAAIQAKRAAAGKTNRKEAA